MINGSVKRELEKRSEDLVLRRADEVISYVLHHMDDPPKTLKTLTLDLKSAVHDLKKRREEK